MSFATKGVSGTALILFFGLCTLASSADEARVLPPTLNVSSGEVVFNSSLFQAGIRGHQDLGALASETSAIGAQAVAFGFAAKSAEAKFFIIGSLYAEALAYLRSDHLELAAKRLEAIEQELISLQAPDSLYHYLSTTRHLLETRRYSAEVLRELLALFQPFCEDYAKSQGEDKLTLFRAGSWLVDMSLAAAAGDWTLLRQPARLQYFSHEMKRLNAPQGVLEALEQLAQIVEKPELTDADAKQVLELVQQVQTILA